MTSQWVVAANARTLFGGSKELPAALLTTNAVVPFSVENTVDYNRSFYGNTQQTTTARHGLISHYRRLLSRILENPDLLANASSSSAAELNEAENTKEQLIRLVGIVTQLPEPHSNDKHAIWEFYSISNMHDDDQFHVAFDALSSTASIAAAAGGSDMQEYVPGRLALFCGALTRFTGLYPGVCLGVVGTVCRRDLEGRITSILVKDIVHVPRPQFPWNKNISVQNNNAVREAIRVQFAAGPFPRRDMLHIVSECTQQALHRHVDVLVLGGPFFPPFQDYEKNELALMPSTLEDQLNGVVDTIEKVLSRYTAKHRKLRVLLVPSVDDLMQVPVLPQPMFSLALDDDSAVQTTSNPCRFVVNGVTFGVVNHDVVSDLQAAMIERSAPISGSLQRVTEAVVQSRLFMPIQSVPSPLVDLRHVDSLSLAKLPTSSLASASAEQQREEPPVDTDTAAGFTTGELRPIPQPATEELPHILFSPSVKPEFAHVTHSKTLDLSSANGDGCLVINPQLWVKGRGTGYYLNVSEVTISDAKLVSSHGVGYASEYDLEKGGTGVCVTLRTIAKN